LNISSGQPASECLKPVSCNRPGPACIRINHSHDSDVILSRMLPPSVLHPSQCHFASAATSHANGSSRSTDKPPCSAFVHSDKPRFKSSSTSLLLLPDHLTEMYLRGVHPLLPSQASRSSKAASASFPRMTECRVGRDGETLGG
jgi:hypothetical protein